MAVATISLAALGASMAGPVTPTQDGQRLTVGMVFGGTVARPSSTELVSAGIPPLGDARVRDAITMVFDRQSLTESLEASNRSNVQAAQALMAEAGYAEGFALRLPTIEGYDFGSVMWYVRQQLGLLRIDVEPVPLSGVDAMGGILGGVYPVVLLPSGDIDGSASLAAIEVYPSGEWDLLYHPGGHVGPQAEHLAFAAIEASTQP